MLTFADFEKSVRRSPARLRVLLMLASLSVSYPTPLARAANVNVHRLHQIMFGDAPDYAVGLSLVRLGLVHVVHGANGRAFEITSRGRRFARRLSARAVRQELRRRAARPVSTEVARAPAPSWTVTWSVGAPSAPAGS